MSARRPVTRSRQRAASVTTTAASTRSRRGTSIPLEAPAVKIIIPANPVPKVSKIKSGARPTHARKCTAASTTPTEQVIKPANRLPEVEPVANSARSGYGCARARIEDEMMQDHVKAALAHGLVDEDVAKEWTTSWHSKSILDMQWNEDIISKYNKENGIETVEVMELRKAEAAARKKDAEEKKFLEEFFAGMIDADGRKIEGEEENEECSGKARPTKKPVSRRLAKKTPLPVVLEEEQAPTPTTSKSSEDSTSVKPMSGLPDYTDFSYYQLAAICFERNLKSGGKEQDLRDRLVQDDINVIHKLPREAKPYSRERWRKRKHAAPVVPNAPVASPAKYSRSAKRGREDEDDEEDGEDEDQCSNKKARMQ